MITKAQALAEMANVVLRLEGADETPPKPCDIASAVCRCDAVLWLGKADRDAAFDPLVQRYTPPQTGDVQEAA